MKKIRILCWNVNGLRAVQRKGALKPVLKGKADIICLQETKVNEGTVPKEFRDMKGYHSYFSSARKEMFGYSAKDHFCAHCGRNS